MKLHRAKLILRGIVAGALATSFCLAPTVAWATCRGDIVAAPGEGVQSALANVATVSATDAWAVGSYVASSGSTTVLFEHWNGTNWSIVTSPNLGPNDAVLTDIAAISSTNVWAVGYGGNSGNGMLIEHWNGTTWSVVPSPTLPSGYFGFLSAVTALSGSAILAGGSYSYPHCLHCTRYSGPLMEYWNGSTWTAYLGTAEPGYYGPGFRDVSVVPSHNTAWAVGAQGMPPQTLIAKWNATGWAVVSSPNASGSDGLFGTASIPATNRAWAVGYDETSISYPQTLVEKFDGTNWSIVQTPNVSYNDVLADVAVTGPTSAWAVGSYTATTPVGNTSIALAIHWNGTSWSVVAIPSLNVPTNLSGVAAIPGSPDFWAVGSAGSHPLTELLHC